MLKRSQFDQWEHLQIFLIFKHFMAQWNDPGPACTSVAWANPLLPQPPWHRPHLTQVPTSCCCLLAGTQLFRKREKEEERLDRCQIDDRERERGRQTDFKKMFCSKKLGNKKSSSPVLERNRYFDNQKWWISPKLF